jgi:hypothetical protein
LVFASKIVCCHEADTCQPSSCLHILFFGVGSFRSGVKKKKDGRGLPGSHTRATPVGTYPSSSFPFPCSPWPSPLPIPMVVAAPLVVEGGERGRHPDGSSSPGRGRPRAAHGDGGKRPHTVRWRRRSRLEMRRRDLQRPGGVLEEASQGHGGSAGFASARPSWAMEATLVELQCCFPCCAPGGGVCAAVEPVNVALKAAARARSETSGSLYY